MTRIAPANASTGDSTRMEAVREDLDEAEMREVTRFRDEAARVLGVAVEDGGDG